MPAMILPLLLGALLAGAGRADTPRPLRLVTEQLGAEVRFRVVGEAAGPCDASYVLTVANRAAAGSNRSIQRGAARLRPGAATTLATATLRAAPGSWSATLAVRGCGPDAVYEEKSGAFAPRR